MCCGQSSGATGTSSTIYRVLGAAVLQLLGRQQYGVRLLIVVLPHTFGRHLNFNCHLHILVSEGGLRDDDTTWRARAPLARPALMPLWRDAVIEYLQAAGRAGVLDTEMALPALEALLAEQARRWWNTDIKRFRGKKHFLAYAGRYARHPPIAEHRFRNIDRAEIRFETKDTRTQRRVMTRYTPAAFVATLADHVPDRYRHNVRYFGLLAPRLKGRTHDAVFRAVGQERRGKPKRVPWAAAIKKSFGINPLVDREGQHMRWVCRLAPSQPP